MAGAGAEHRQDAIYYWETNISQGVNANNSYYLGLLSFKGDELEWPGWCNQVGGLKLLSLFTRAEGLIY